MSDNEKLIKAVKNVSVYTREEREEWVKRIKSGDKKAIEAAKKLIDSSTPAPSEREIGIDDKFKKVGNRIIKVKKGSKHTTNTKKVQKQTNKEEVVKAIEQHERNKLSLLNQGTAPAEKILQQKTNVDEFKRRVYSEAADNLIMLEDVNQTIQQRKAQIKQARQDLNQAEQILESKKGSLTEEEYMQYKKQIDKARADLTKAEVQLTAKELELKLEKQKMAKEVDALIQQYEKQKHEYGSDNDLIDYAISGVVGGVTGAISGAVAGGPAGAVVGGFIGATSGVAGQAAGEYVTAKTGNKWYGLAADLGVGLISGLAEAKAVSTAIRETAEISSESSMKLLLKEESDDVVRGIAKVDSEVNIKSLGGMLKTTKEVEGVYDLRTIKRIKEGIKDYSIIQKVTGKDEVYDTSLRYITKVDDELRVGSGHSSSKAIMDYTDAVDKSTQERYAVNEVKAFVESKRDFDKTLLKRVNAKEELGMVTFEDNDYVEFIGQGKLKDVNHEFKFKGVYKRADESNIVKYDSVVRSDYVKVDKEINDNIVKNVSSEDVVSLQKQEIKEVRDVISKDVSSLKSVHQSVIEDIAEETLEDMTKSIRSIGIIAPVIATGVKTIAMSEFDVLQKNGFKGIEKIGIGKVPDISEGIDIDIKTITTPDVDVRTGLDEISSQEIEELNMNKTSIDVPSTPDLPDVDYARKFNIDFDFPSSQYLSKKRKRKKERYSEIEYRFGDLW